MDFPALYTVLKLAKKENEEKTSKDIRRELAIILGTCLPLFLKETDMSLLNVPAGKDLPKTSTLLLRSRLTQIRSNTKSQRERRTVR